MDFGFVFIPPELLANIVRDLPLRDIKSVRRVCHILGDVATPFLFVELYISSHLTDRENFTAVSEHPIFSQSVQKVIYDSTNISPEDVWEDIRMSKASYTRFFHAGGYGRGGKRYTKAAVRRGYRSFEASYKQQAALAEYSDDELTHPNEAGTRPHDFSSILEDVDRFPEVARFLPDDLVRLARGLSRMPNIRHFEISDRRHARNSNRYRHRYADVSQHGINHLTFWIKNEGTRGIDEVIMDPRPWPGSHEKYDVSGWGPSWYRGFYVLTQAASITKMKTLESFEVHRDCTASGLSLLVFSMPPRQLHHTANAFANLKSIKLKIQNIEGVLEYPESSLSRVLASAQQLECLDIRVDEAYEAWVEGTTTFEKVIGDLYWPKLHQATFGYMTLSESSFLPFFRKHRHILRSLHLEQVHLPFPTDASFPPQWARIFQAMALDGSALSCLTLRSERPHLPSPICVHCCHAAAMQSFLKSGGVEKPVIPCPRPDEHMWDEEFRCLKLHF